MGPLFLALLQLAAPPATQAAPAAKPKMICERTEVIGSRVQGKRVCFTPEEYAQYRLQLRELSEKQANGYFQESRGSCKRGVDC